MKNKIPNKVTCCSCFYRYEINCLDAHNTHYCDKWKLAAALICFKHEYWITPETCVRRLKERECRKCEMRKLVIKLDIKPVDWND